MRVLLATTECSPLVGNSGCADAVAGLAQGLAANGIEVVVVLPRYRQLQSMGELHLDGRSFPTVYRHQLGAVSFYLIDDPAAFERSQIDGFSDDWWRWGRFCMAVRALADTADVVHLHDAHVGPVALRCSRPTVLTVHNPNYPISAPLAEAADLLHAEETDVAPLGALEWWGQADFLKAGLARAKRIAVVSTDTLDLLGRYGGVLAARSDSPAVVWNGIDVHTADPSSNQALSEPFSAADLSGRLTARAELIRRWGIADGVLLTYAGRMVGQKGVQLLVDQIQDLVSEGLRLILIGHGDADIDDMVDEWVRRFDHRVVHLSYDAESESLAMAGAEAFLAAERIASPRGLLQALRYGCLPVAHRTPYQDMVPDAEEDPENGMGFHFDPWAPEALATAIRRMMRFRDGSPEAWEEAQRRAMRFDSSWKARSREYIRVYEEAIYAD